MIIELEELRDALKIASNREYALGEELLVSVEKKTVCFRWFRGRLGEKRLIKCVGSNQSEYWELREA